MARALKIHSGFPIQFWGEYVLTVVYIISRLPSLVLQNKCACEILYNKPSVYDDPKLLVVWLLLLHLCQIQTSLQIEAFLVCLLVILQQIRVID